MFLVRFARASPPMSSWNLPARCLCRCLPTPSRLSPRMPPLCASLCAWAGRECFQPASEFRHVQHQGHGLDVYGALRARASPPISSWSSARCLCRRLPTPSRLSPRMSPLCASLCGWADRLVITWAPVQPAAEFRHVQRHDHGQHVLGALRACLTPNVQLGLPCALLAPPSAPALPPRSLRICPTREPRPCDSAGRERVQPAAEFRHVERQGHELHVFGAPYPQCTPNVQLVSPVHSACTATGPRPSAFRPACRALMYHLV